MPERHRNALPNHLERMLWRAGHIGLSMRAVIQARIDAVSNPVAAMRACLGLLRLAENAVLPAPLHLVFVGAPGPDQAWHLRHLIELRRGRGAVVIADEPGLVQLHRLADELLSQGRRLGLSRPQIITILNDRK